MGMTGRTGGKEPDPGRSTGVTIGASGNNLPFAGLGDRNGPGGRRRPGLAVRTYMPTFTILCVCLALVVATT